VDAAEAGWLATGKVGTTPQKKREQGRSHDKRKTLRFELSNEKRGDQGVKKR